METQAKEYQDMIDMDTDMFTTHELNEFQVTTKQSMQKHIYN